MTLNRKALALSAGLVGTLLLSTTASAQRGGSSSDAQTITLKDCRIDWLQVSSVSALREGVIEKMELRVGQEVGKAGDVIGILYKRSAELATREAEIQAKSQGGIMKAQAQKELALAKVQRDNMLNKKIPGSVAAEVAQTNQAEFAVADASLFEARDTQALAEAKLESARQIVEEHIIRAPFAGIIFEEFKHVGESVSSREPIVKLGNLDRLRVWGYLPVEYAYRVETGKAVEVQVRLSDDPSSGKHPIEQKKFRGVITLVDPSLQAIGESGVRIHVEIANPDKELRPGTKAVISIKLGPETAGGVARPAPAVNTTQDPNLLSRDSGLPPLPR